MISSMQKIILCCIIGTHIHALEPSEEEARKKLAKATTIEHIDLSDFGKIKHAVIATWHYVTPAGTQLYNPLTQSTTELQRDVVVSWYLCVDIINNTGTYKKTDRQERRDCFDGGYSLTDQNHMAALGYLMLKEIDRRKC